MLAVPSGNHNVASLSGIIRDLIHGAEGEGSPLPFPSITPRIGRIYVYMNLKGYMAYDTYIYTHIYIYIYIYIYIMVYKCVCIC